MTYRFAVEPSSVDRHLASGSVIRSIPGRPALPVRLVRELAAAATDTWQRPGDRPVVWDPCCGLGHLLVCAALSQDVALALASDVDPDAVDLARRNLELLKPEGLADRAREIGHRDDADATIRPVYSILREPAPATRTFVADATDPTSCALGLGDVKPDIVLTDTPYGDQTVWADASREVGHLLASMEVTTAPGAVVGLVTSNRLRLPATTWQRAGTWNIGKRRVWLLHKGEK